MRNTLMYLINFSDYILLIMLSKTLIELIKDGSMTLDSMMSQKMLNH